MSVVAFFLLLLILLLLPFLPGIIEIRRKLDAQPLSVIQHYDVNIHHFADRFRHYIHTHFARDLSAIRTTAESKQGTLEDGSHYCLLGAHTTPPFDEAEQATQVTNKLYVTAADLELPGAMTYLNGLYADGAIKGADEDIYRAVLAGANIHLGQNSMLLRWMHAAGEIQVAPGSVLHGRISADKLIALASPARFERLNAPDILFGEHPASPPSAPPRQDINPEDLAVNVEVAGGRWLIEDDVVLADNSRVNANLVVIGTLSLGENCEINGSIKSHKPLYIKAGCEVHGSVVCMQDIYIESYARLKGPLVSETHIHIAPHSQIGSTRLPTTITAHEITLQAGCLAHGTVWARAAGNLTA